MKILHRAIPVAVLMGAAVASPCFAIPSLLSPAVAATAMATPDNRNAALYYWRAFYTLDRDFQRAAADMLDEKRTADWRPSDTAITRLKENSDFINQVLTASRIDKCDFGIAYDEGFMALLPHLGLFRQGARILALDAHRLMSEGQPDEAAERIAAIYRMSVHVRNDSVLISSLVSMAMASLAADEALMFAEAGKLTDKGRAAIISAMQPLNQSDGFGAKRAIDTERRIIMSSLRKTLTGPDAGKKLVEMPVLDFDAAKKEQILAMDEAGVRNALDQMEKAYTDMLAIWDSANYEKGLEDFGAKIQNGEYGVISQVLVPTLGRAKSSDVKAHQRLDEVLRTLRSAKVREPVTNQSGANQGDAR